MSGDDHVGRILRELRESAEHQRFREGFRNRTMRQLVPFFGTWCPWVVPRKGQWHVVRISFVFVVLITCLTLFAVCSVLVLLFSY
jgi:hypothetical protein